MRQTVHTRLRLQVMLFFCAVVLFFGAVQPVKAGNFCCLEVHEQGVTRQESCFNLEEKPCAPAVGYSTTAVGRTNVRITITRNPIACSSKADLCHYGTAGTRVDCSTAMKSTDPVETQRDDCGVTGNCFYAGGQCLDKYDPQICSILPKELCGTNEGTKPTVCQWNEDTRHCLPALENTIGNQYGTADPNGILSTCALQGNCRSLNDIVVSFIRLLKFAFGLAGSLAFAAFIYGGLLMILSFGNAERVEQGKGALVAAVIGIAIAFSAYVLIGYLLDVFSTGTGFRIF